jgi:1-aminocyclopropane-1-carboxylate deaminase/D-cysteine desulfhydrase-like pyridoxal-dependent ACC family enzyme
VTTVESGQVVDTAALTPWELRGGMWFKRDDLFRPFADIPLSGGKVRQAIALLTTMRQRILTNHGGVVLTGTGVHSPQGLIIARVAVGLGLRCVVFSSANDVSRHVLLRRVLEVGAQVNTSAGTGYESALMAAMQRWQREHDQAGYVVRFGINLDDAPQAIMGTTAQQVQNIPAGVERVVIPVGAGITAAGIILGLQHYRPDVRAVCVQIAGYDRRKQIDAMTWGGADYDWYSIKGIPYGREIHRTVRGLTLDPIYEAKAYDWAYQRRAALPHSAFWIVGDSTDVR